MYENIKLSLQETKLTAQEYARLYHLCVSDNLSFLVHKKKRKMKRKKNWYHSKI